VLRGLHYQLQPHAQGKLVRVLEGRIWDVAVDISKKSPNFKNWVGVELSEENGLALYIPEGFAHGFVTLSETARVLYKTTAEYNKESERGIIWNDPELQIHWPVKEPVLSEKDKLYPTLEKADVFN
jgi:dTDP-4-dehydrorhamnose 3,5-epimerase